MRHATAHQTNENECIKRTTTLTAPKRNRWSVSDVDVGEYVVVNDRNRRQGNWRHIHTAYGIYAIAQEFNVIHDRLHDALRWLVYSLSVHMFGLLCLPSSSSFYSSSPLSLSCCSRRMEISQNSWIIPRPPDKTDIISTEVNHVQCFRWFLDDFLKIHISPSSSLFLNYISFVLNLSRFSKRRGVNGVWKSSIRTRKKQENQNWTPNVNHLILLFSQNSWIFSKHWKTLSWHLNCSSTFLLHSVTAQLIKTLNYLWT